MVYYLNLLAGCMINANVSIDLIFYAELVLVIVSSILFYFELKTLNANLSDTKTQLLTGFLLSLNLTYITRALGILTEEIWIRTYLTGIIALSGGILFIIWGAKIVGVDNWLVYASFGFLLFGMLTFFGGRIYGISFFSILGLVMMTLGPFILMVLIFQYVFSSSPYVRARHRLFTLTLSFGLYAIFEGMAVAQLGSANYASASILFLLVLPWRMGITLSILLPQKYTSFLMKFIH